MWKIMWKLKGSSMTRIIPGLCIFGAQKVNFLQIFEIAARRLGWLWSPTIIPLILEYVLPCWLFRNSFCYPTHSSCVDEPLRSLLAWDVPPHAPITNNICSPNPMLWLGYHPVWYHVTSICLSHVSDEGMGAGLGPRSAMDTIGNCLSHWKTHFHISKTRIRTRGS